MNASEVKWASQHDWYRGWAFQDSCDDSPYLVLVVDTIVVEPGVIELVSVPFSDFSLLYKWAGYGG